MLLFSQDALQDPPVLKNCLPPYYFLPSWFHLKFLPKMSYPYDAPPRYHMKYPHINYLSFILKDMLSLSQSCFMTFLIKHM